MTDFECYLSEGKFTKFDDHCKYISDKIDNNHPIKEIDRFVKSIPYKKENNLWRKRTAGDIINDNFVTGCTDACLVFVTLSRIKRIPAIYVETIEEGFLTEPVGIIQGHIFADTSKNGKWMSNNPGHGRTNKNGKKYLWDDGPYPTYIEIARGLDFSELYQEGAQKPIDLSSMEQLRNQIKRI